MPSPFKALESRLNRAVIARLSNVDATVTTPFGEVLTFSGIFDAPYQAAGVFEAEQPSILARADEVPGVDHTSQLRIAEQTWQVVGVQPDGTGMTRLVLERAP